MDDKRWTPSGDGSRPDMDRDRIWMDDLGGWQEMDDRRWISGDGSLETDDNRSLSYVKILRLCEVIRFSRSRLWFQATKLQSSADIQTYDVPAAWLHRVRYRALFRALFRDTELCSYTPEFPCRIRSRVTQLQCRYRTSWSRTILVFGGATIFNEGDDSAGTTTTPTANNYRTGSAGTKHRETHSPIEKASSGMCTQGSDGKRTYGLIKKPHVQVTIPNEILTQSRQSRLSLGNPDVHGCYGLLVGGATTHKRGWPYRNQKQPLPQAITVPEVLGGNTMECTYRQRIAAGD